MRKKPGPTPYKPTRTQQQRVMRGVAIGLKLEDIATDLGMAYGTMRRVFASEIRVARTRLILDTVDRLHKAAGSGSVSAMKLLLEMAQRYRPDPFEDDEDDGAWQDALFLT